MRCRLVLRLPNQLFVVDAVAEKPQLEIPPPTEVDEVLPESAPNDPNVLPEQPKPEPESKQLPQVGEIVAGYILVHEYDVVFLSDQGS